MSLFLRIFVLKNKGEMIELIQRNWLVIAGTLLGAVGGYLYYHFIGCTSGSCAITSQPVNSTLYGALLGGLFLNMLRQNPRPGGHQDQKRNQ